MYKIEITKKALKFIQKQSVNQQKKILSAIKLLPNGDVKILQGHNGIYRLRIGNYRIIYTINETRLIITVVDAGNRGEIYIRY